MQDPRRLPAGRVLLAAVPGDWFNRLLATTEHIDLERCVRRNTLVLATTMAVYSVVLQLVAAVSSITFVLITGIEDCSDWDRPSSWSPPRWPPCRPGGRWTGRAAAP